jgi:hypothetical protein
MARPQVTRSTTILGYVVLAIAAMAYQLAGLLFDRTATLGQAVKTLKSFPAARPLLFLGWLWLGWHTFIRGTPG